MLLKPVPAEADGCFELFVSQELTVGPVDKPFVMGGVSFGAALEALERATGRPTSWATCQFVGTAGLGETLDIQATIDVAARRTSLASALVTASGRPVIKVMSAHAGWDAPVADKVFARMPKNVPPPEDCGGKDKFPFESDGNLVDQFIRRVVPQDDEHGRELLWFRSKESINYSVGAISIIADFMLGALPSTEGATSLDNTLRLHTTDMSGWLLVETEIESLQSGVVHGRSQIFTQDGRFVASASQTGLVPRAPVR